MGDVCGVHATVAHRVTYVRTKYTAEAGRYKYTAFAASSERRSWGRQLQRIPHQILNIVVTATVREVSSDGIRKIRVVYVYICMYVYVRTYGCVRCLLLAIDTRVNTVMDTVRHLPLREPSKFPEPMIQG